MRLPRATIERLHWTVLGFVLVCIGGAVPVIVCDPVVAAIAVAVGALAAIAGYVVHQDAVLLSVTVLIFPTIGMGLLALCMFLGVPLTMILAIAPSVFAAVLLVLTADAPVDPAQ